MKNINVFGQEGEARLAGLPEEALAKWIYHIISYMQYSRVSVCAHACKECPSMIIKWIVLVLEDVLKSTI